MKIQYFDMLILEIWKWLKIKRGIGLTVSIMYCFLVVFPSTVYDVLKTYPRHLSSICVEIIKKYRLTAEAQRDTMQTFENVLRVVFMKLLLSLCFVKTYYRRYRNWAFYNALWYWLGIRQKKIPQEKCRKICRKYNKLIGSPESPHRPECIFS